MGIRENGQVLDAAQYRSLDGPTYSRVKRHRLSHSDSTEMLQTEDRLENARKIISNAIGPFYNVFRWLAKSQLGILINTVMIKK